MQRSTHTFGKGWVTDLNPSIPQNESYQDAYNISLTGDGNTLAATNIKGSQLVSKLIAAIDGDAGSLRVMRSASMDVEFDGVQKEALVAFVCYKATLSGSQFAILVYRPDTNITYKVFEQIDLSDRILKAHMSVVVQKERGLNFVYFADGLSPIRAWRAVVNTASPAVTADALKLQRMYPGGSISVSGITESSVPTMKEGTYQFAYQLADSRTGKMTNFSLLTEPARVFYTGKTTSPYVKRIALTIQMDGVDRDLYNTSRVAVVRWDESGKPPAVAELLPFRDLPPSGIPSTTFFYDGEEDKITAPIAELVTEAAAIKAVNHLLVKNNILMPAGITYKDRRITTDITLDSSASGIIKRVVNYESPVDASKYVGYFRDEVYRFAVAYYDEDGNFSEPQVLKLSNVEGNRISNGSNDFRFPKRDDSYTDAEGVVTSNAYSLYDGAGKIEALGLALRGIKNHPAWAKGIAILRAKRKKNILFQSPLVNTHIVEPLPALLSYPGEGENPPSPLGTITPKNFFFGAARDIVRNSSFNTWAYKQEVTYYPAWNDTTRVHMVFPPESLYLNGMNQALSPYVHRAGDKLKVVDMAGLNFYFSDYCEGERPSGYESKNAGEFINTHVCGTFSAKGHDNYYYTRGRVGVSKLDALDYGGKFNTETPVLEAVPVDNMGGATILTKSLRGYRTNRVGDYESMRGTLSEGMQPNNQRGYYISTKKAMSDPSYYASDAAGDTAYKSTTATQVSAFKNIISFGSASKAITKKYMDGSLQETSNALLRKSQLTAATDLVSAVAIVNVEAGLEDSRYGSASDYNEYIFTGAHRNLTATEVKDNLPVNLDVWGGDCFIGPHHFKVSDTVYAVSNVDGTESDADSKALWGRSFLNNDNTPDPMRRPLPLNGASQILTVVIESEINPYVMHDDMHYSGLEVSQEKAFLRIPFLYNYPLNQSAQNISKVLVPTPKHEKPVFEFPSRLAYSRKKIYQTNESGFDIFPAMNIYDMEETHGAITGLASFGGRVYVCQEKNVAYLPIGERILETSDSNQLAVRSQDFINDPDYISRLGGVTDPGSVLVTPVGIVGHNGSDGRILLIAGQDVKDIVEGRIEQEYGIIRDKGLLTMRSYYDLDEKNILFHLQHPAKGERLLVFNHKLGAWIGKWMDSDVLPFRTAITMRGKTHLLGINGSDLEIHQMYAGNPAEFFGKQYASSLTFRDSSDFSNTKTYDLMRVNASRQLLSVDAKVTQENLIGTQEALGMNLDINPSEGNYRIRVMLDANKRRLRGQYADFTMRWNNPAFEIASLYSTELGYRISNPI